jgi:hypothetical protein
LIRESRFRQDAACSSRVLSVMHARPANADDVDYVLKQRRWAGPDIAPH